MLFDCRSFTISKKKKGGKKKQTIIKNKVYINDTLTPYTIHSQHSIYQ